jgi:hypothetical protein
MTQDEAKQAQQLTEQVVLTRIAKKDAELTAQAAQRQYDNFLASVVSKGEAAGGSSGPVPVPSSGSAPAWLKSGS